MSQFTHFRNKTFHSTADNRATVAPTNAPSAHMVIDPAKTRKPHSRHQHTHIVKRATLGHFFIDHLSPFTPHARCVQWVHFLLSVAPWPGP